MSKHSLPEIIAYLQQVSQEIAPSDAERSAKIDSAIRDLQELDTPSKTDQAIDRTKKIIEILAAVAKIIYDFSEVHNF